MIGQLFVQIHPHSACSKMHAHFAASYLEHSTNVAEIDSMPAAIAAVA
ncbi:MAG TPA: hypothetical protein VKR43_07230 [Bryobacteraceae bacterium]|nr:hypothetical protein [Bryobacteraceae bacterium]